MVPAFVSDETGAADDIRTPEEARPSAAGAASRWWLHHSLLALAAPKSSGMKVWYKPGHPARAAR